MFWENFEKRGEFIKNGIPLQRFICMLEHTGKEKEEKQWDDEVEERNAEQY